MSYQNLELGSELPRNDEIAVQEDEPGSDSDKYFNMMAFIGLATLVKILAIMGIASMFTVAVISIWPHETPSLHSSILKSASTVKWTFNRKGYDPLAFFSASASEYLKYEFLTSYDAILEPHASMHLYVDSYNSKSSGYYSVRVCSNSGECKVGNVKNNGKAFEYKSVQFDCQPFESFVVTIYKYSDTDELEKEYSGSAICMYVRREIRALTSDDLTATMDAMYALWSTSDDEGKKLYGDDFHNITYLLQMHHFNAAWLDADHFHEGNGFLAQHIKMTNYFEKVLQVVDPSVTVPYWDFTIESAARNFIYESPVMSADMFGSLRVPDDTDKEIGYTYARNNITDFAIQDGRWAFAKAVFNPSKFPDLEGGYGYMRSPWNMNPSPYVTRFTGTSYLPTCTSHMNMLSYTDMMDFMIEVEVAPHAGLHGVTGGTYGCDLFDDLLASGAITDEENKMMICKLWIFTLKSLYRKNLIHASKGCTVSDDLQSSFCGFDCEKGQDYAIKSLLLTNLINKRVPSDMGTDNQEKWLSFMCGWGDGSGEAARVFSGDHAESASPSDPSFWPIHPTLERLFQAKLMVGGFKSSEWATDVTKSTVCTRYYCVENNIYSIFKECCYGHFEDSRMYDFETGNKTAHFGPTNGETINGTNPVESWYSMPYIYDSFSWDHCVDEPNGDLNSKLDDLYSESQRRN